MTSVEPATILLVDDREENLLALEAILSSLGHILVRARSGAEALKHLLTADVSLILLDVQMPEMDGWQMLSTIREHPRLADMPVIVCTVKGSAEDAGRALTLGADGYVAKPFTIDQLVEEVAAVATRRAMHPERG